MGQRKYIAESVGPRIDAFLRRIFKSLRLHVTFEISDNENPHPHFESADVMVRFGGADVGDLLANRTEVMLALEHLTMEMLRMPAEDHSRLCFDANDYRILRVEELRMNAQTAAAQVKASRMPFKFGPMTSRERRVLHMALREESDVRSESLGSEPFRQVVIYPAGMPSLPEPPPGPLMRRPGRRR
ncbi:MAG: protein jag [Bryobacteraceae bacterium]